MDFKLISEVTTDKYTRKKYEIGRYNVYETNYGDDKPLVEVSINKGDKLFLPSIETIYDYNSEIIVNFKINPASYGSLSYEDIEIMISSLNNALETVKELKRKYIGKI